MKPQKKEPAIKAAPTKPSSKADAERHEVYGPRYIADRTWISLMQFLLQRLDGRPWRGILEKYDVDRATGIFTRSYPPSIASEAQRQSFQIATLFCHDSYEDVFFGVAPKGIEYDDIHKFWRSACNDVHLDFVEGRVALWARNGTMAGAFREIADVTWLEASRQTLKNGDRYPYATASVEEWIANTCVSNQLTGIDGAKLFDLHVAGWKKVQTKEITSREEAEDIIKKQMQCLGVGRLTTRELDELRRNKCPEITREDFSKIDIKLNGPRSGPGRPPSR